MLTRSQIFLLAAATVLLLGLFSPGIYDSDFWWHLRTGQHIAETRSLPVPDPFAWTTAAASAHDSYPGEARTRYFNLTHEWLAQVAIFAVYRVAGFGGVVAVRALSMTAFCGLIGLVAWRRRGNLVMAVAAALAAASVVANFALDRPYQVTFLLLAATLALVEYDCLWPLPPLFLVWANCHSGYFLGWVVLGAHCAASLVRRERRPKLWAVTAACVALSAANPNGFGVFRTLLDYRASFLQGKLVEWTPPAWWPPSPFSALLAAAALVMVWQWRKVRLADWLIFATFAAATLEAQRNLFLTAAVAPPLIAAYLPWKASWKVPRAEVWTTLLVVCGIAVGVARGPLFQIRSGDWRFPSGSADFLLTHHVTAPMFNTYEQGGYLIWRLWPMQRVFIDGRALSESLFMDYARILYNHDDSDGGKSGEALLAQYGVQVVVMNTFEAYSGALYLLAPSLADPNQSKWRLVYQEPQALVFMQTPPDGVAPLDKTEIFAHMETECQLHLDHEPQFPRCARSLGQMFARIGELARARKWVGIYLAHPHPPDSEAEDAWRNLVRLGG
jgi:hypothetical protein